MINWADIKEFFKSDSAQNFAEESLESFVLPEVLQDLPYFLDILAFEPQYITYKGSYSHTNYKVPGGFNYDAFVKAEPMQINIVNAFFKPVAGLGGFAEGLFKGSHGKNVGSLDVMLLKFLGWQQKHVPILLKTTKFVGPVLLVDWEVKEAAAESYFNLTLKQTSFRKLKQYTYQGEAGPVQNLGVGDAKGNVGLDK